MKNTSLRRPLLTATSNEPNPAAERADFRARLRERLFGRAYPLWVDGEGVLPAASLWFLIRERLEIMRQSGLRSGDRIMLSLSSDRELLAWTLAALWEGCPAALAAPTAQPDDARQTAAYLSARALVQDLAAKPSLTLFPSAASDEQSTSSSSSLSSFSLSSSSLSSSFLTPSDAPALFLATSGTSGKPRWIALSVRNIFSVVDSHLPALGLASPAFSSPDNEYPAARVLSLLPLQHAFGLVIDVFAALFAGAEIVRAAQGGRDTEEILRLAEAHTITHCSMTPLTASRLAGFEQGRDFLRGLTGGVVGGAPAREKLAQFLRETRLRVGYGQTEASPGITLGEPGVWLEGYLGEPLGCEIRLGDGGELEFRGDNACVGMWTDEGFLRFEPNRWVKTGDIARRSEREEYTGFIYLGRVNDYFKLANGRWIPAPEWERILREELREIADAALYPSADNERCDCVVVARAAEPHNESAGAFAAFLRSEIARILPLPPNYWGTLLLLSPEQWRATPKGDADRRALLAELRRYEAAMRFERL